MNIPFSLNSICQNMYTLNVMARERKFQKWQADVVKCKRLGNASVFCFAINSCYSVNTRVS